MASTIIDIEDLKKKYPEILDNTVLAINNYWKNEQFREGEDYAYVTVDKNIESEDSVFSHIQYLTDPEDLLRDVNKMGSWTLRPFTNTTDDTQSKKVVSEPNPQPKENIVSAPIVTTLSDVRPIEEVSISISENLSSRFPGETNSSSFSRLRKIL